MEKIVGIDRTELIITKDDSILYTDHYFVGYEEMDSYLKYLFKDGFPVMAIDMLNVPKMKSTLKGLPENTLMLNWDANEQHDGGFICVINVSELSSEGCDAIRQMSDVAGWNIDGQEYLVIAGIG